MVASFAQIINNVVPKDKTRSLHTRLWCDKWEFFSGSGKVLGYNTSATSRTRHDKRDPDQYFWISVATRCISANTVTVILIGNKSDLNLRRVVKKDTAAAWAKKQNLTYYFETSAVCFPSSSKLLPRVADRECRQRARRWKRRSFFSRVFCTSGLSLQNRLAFFSKTIL